MSSIPNNQINNFDNTSSEIKVESPFEDGKININIDSENKIQSINNNNNQSNELKESNKNQDEDVKNTLDEPVIDTLKRDLYKIYIKLRYVIIPKFNKSADEQTNTQLKDWDLYGPLLFTLLLCV